MSTYRDIYKRVKGPIPKDETGRSYDIHHIDGDRKNNNIDNLIAVSIQEHYNIHYSQGDWAACLKIANRMALPHNVLSELGRKNALKQIKNGKNAFVGGKMQEQTQLQRVSRGEHHFLSGDIQRKNYHKRVANGTWHLSDGEISRRTQLERVSKGTHNLQGPTNNQMMLSAGKHSSQIKKQCPHCGKICSANTFGNWHGNKCKFKKSEE